MRCHLLLVWALVASLAAAESLRADDCCATGTCPNECHQARLQLSPRWSAKLRKYVKTPVNRR
ncbi:hypothetical protein SPRG_12996, partial [Saprolegnia parasitica CBS 223.65]